MLLSAVLIIASAMALTIPVWISAKLFSAERDGWLICLAAAIVSSVIFQIVNAAAGGLGGLALGALAAGLVFKSLLKLSLLNGLWASFIAFGIQVMLVGTFNAQLAKLVVAHA